MDNISQAKAIRAGFKILRKEETPRPRIMYKDKQHPTWSPWGTYTSVDHRNRVWDNIVVGDYILVD